MYKSKNPINLELSLDMNKRHFVFGDIHGNYDGMMSLLKSVNYNKDSDIIYCVGDLIDIGHKSLDVLNFFLDNTHTYSCLGNHEHMVLNKSYHSTWMNNGGIETLKELMHVNGLTLEDLCTKQADEIIKSFTSRLEILPYIINVGNEKDPNHFRIIHAEFPLDHNEELIKTEILEEDDNFLMNLLWSRKDITRLSILKVENLPECVKISKYLKDRQTVKTFSGHTPLRKVQQYGNRFYIDTHYKNLTMINAITNEIHRIKKEP